MIGEKIKDLSATYILNPTEQIESSKEKFAYSLGKRAAQKGYNRPASEESMQAKTRRGRTYSLEEARAYLKGFDDHMGSPEVQKKRKLKCLARIKADKKWHRFSAQELNALNYPPEIHHVYFETFDAAVLKHKMEKKSAQKNDLDTDTEENTTQSDDSTSGKHKSRAETTTHNHQTHFAYRIGQNAARRLYARPTVEALQKRRKSRPPYNATEIEAYFEGFDSTMKRRSIQKSLKLRDLALSEAQNNSVRLSAEQLISQGYPSKIHKVYFRVFDKISKNSACVGVTKPQHNEQKIQPNSEPLEKTCVFSELNQPYTVDLNAHEEELNGYEWENPLSLENYNSALEPDMASLCHQANIEVSNPLLFKFTSPPPTVDIPQSTLLEVLKSGVKSPLSPS